LFINIQSIKYKTVEYPLSRFITLLIEDTGMCGNRKYVCKCEELGFIKGVGSTEQGAMKDFYRAFSDFWWFINKPKEILSPKHRLDKIKMESLCRICR